MNTNMNIRLERFGLLVTLVACTIIATMAAAGAISRDKTTFYTSLAVVFGLCALIPAWRIIQPDDWLNRRLGKSGNKSEKPVEPARAGDGKTSAR